MSLLKKKKSAKSNKNSRKSKGSKGFSLFSKKKKPVDKIKPKKQAMTFEEFKQSFQSLDGNNYGSWPWVVKVTLIIVMLGVIAMLTYFIPVKKKMTEIEAAEREQEELLKTYTEKESKARHLSEYKNQIAQMEVEFNSLLERLPKETRVSELVKGINMTGLGSDIRFVKITVDPEVKKEYFIEQPIEIRAIGGYHQFGDFIGGLSALPRIITMHDFTLENKEGGAFVFTKEAAERINSSLELVLDTKTYRSKSVSEEAADKKDDKKDNTKKDDKKDDKK